MCPLEKMRDGAPFCRREVRSLQSGLSRHNREIRAIVAYFGGRRADFFLQLRLCGGEAGIRTLGTGISPYNSLAILFFETIPRNPKPTV
jgi:hypothetical protein